MELRDFRNEVARENGWRDFEGMEKGAINYPFREADEAAERYAQHKYLVGIKKGANQQFRATTDQIKRGNIRPAKRSIIQLEAVRLAWSLTTFTEATAISSLRKAEGEIQEIEADIVAGKREPMEYADVLMCIFDSAGRQGISLEEIFDAFEKKLDINLSRTWIKNQDNSYSHVKTEEDTKTEDACKTCGSTENVKQFLGRPLCQKCYDDFESWRV